MTDVNEVFLFWNVTAFSRIAGCFLFLPGISSIRVPQLARLIFTLILTITVVDFVNTGHISHASLPPAGALEVIIVQTIFGLTFGLSARYYILAISFIATASATMIGFSSLMAPSPIENEMEPASASILSYAALLMLFSLDFHHATILALKKSFELVPITAELNIESMVSQIVSNLDDIFIIVFRFCMPFLAYSVIVNLFIALLNRLTPALQLYYIATPAIIIGGIFIVYFEYPVILSYIVSDFELILVLK